MPELHAIDARQPCTYCATRIHLQFPATLNIYRNIDTDVFYPQAKTKGTMWSTAVWLAQGTQATQDVRLYGTTLSSTRVHAWLTCAENSTCE